MKSMGVMTVVLVAAALAGCAATPGSGSWQCSADGLVNAHYTGGDSAMIHLQGFSSGGQYPVKKNGQGTEASGTTANGTPFVCKKQG